MATFSCLGWEPLGREAQGGDPRGCVGQAGRSVVPLSCSPFTSSLLDRQMDIAQGPR